MILSDCLIQYKNYVFLKDEEFYKQITISNNGAVSHRDIKQGALIGRKRQFIIDLEAHPYTLIFTRQGIVGGSIGLIPKDLDGYIATENMPMFEINTKLIIPEYLLMYLKSNKYKQRLKAVLPSGTAQKALHEDVWTKLEIEIPTISKQLVIVNKFNFVNKEIQTVIVQVSKQEKYVSRLRQAILQMAVEGKLTSQDEDDEPASVLLDKIGQEKVKLLKSGNIKKEKPSPKISDEEMSSELPNGWEWCRLSDISNISSGSTPLKSTNEYYDGGEIPWITSSETSKEYIDVSEQYITDLAVKECSLKLHQPGTLIMAMYGQGKTRGQVSELKINATTNQACAAIELFDASITPFIKCYLKKVYIEIRSLAEGGAQPNLNLIKIKSFLCPLPPIVEQQRIVEKVDRLIAMCDELEKSIVVSKKNSELLMQFVLNQAFTDKPQENNIVEFVPPIQNDYIEEWDMAARENGDIKPETADKIAAILAKVGRESK